MTDREGHKEGWGEGGGKEEREGREGEGERGRGEWEEGMEEFTYCLQ